jgi:hypothetical protein
VWLRGIAVYAGVWIVAAVGAQRVMTDPAQPLKSELSRKTAEGSSIEAAIALASTHRQSLEARASVLRDIAGQPDWSMLLRHLIAVRGDDIAFRSVRVGLVSAQQNGPDPRMIATGPYLVTLSGVATDQSSATRFAIEIERHGLFTDVRIVGTSPVRIDGADATQFTIEGIVGVEPRP